MNSTLQFIFFLAMVLTTYGLLNYYFLRKHRFIITGKTFPLALLRLILFTVILAPVATFIFSAKEMSMLASITGFTGYSWLAFLGLFLVIHGILDLFVFILEKRGKEFSKKTIQIITAVAVSVNVIIIFYGFFEAQNIQIEKLSFSSPKIKEGRTIKIVQISDVHFSPIISVHSAKKIRDMVQKQNPDIIISTGDFLDRAIRKKKEVAAVMRTLKAPLGKYAITGNHEFIAGIKYSVDFIKNSGFKLIRNDTVVIEDMLNLTGVDDLSASRFGYTVKISEETVLSKVDSKNYTILLKHQPKVDEKNTQYYDLQLSGHTHAGQIFPFTLFAKIAFPYLCGFYKVNDNTNIYVNRGTGTWGPPIRFLVSPEITVIELKHQK